MLIFSDHSTLHNLCTSYSADPIRVSPRSAQNERTAMRCLKTVYPSVHACNIRNSLTDID